MTDTPPTTGLHHATNICTDLEKTGAFYEDVLGWHTVKRTRNYDDPGSGGRATAGLGFGVGEEPGSEEIDPFEGGER